jgi:hypothetical protein
MLDWLKLGRKWYVIGWTGICLLAIAIVLIFVRRLVGLEA